MALDRRAFEPPETRFYDPPSPWVGAKFRFLVGPPIFRSPVTTEIMRCSFLIIQYRRGA
jgi:hypothetical protein